MSYQLWVNEASTVLVRIFDTGLAEVATRETPAHTWGPPVQVHEQPRWPAEAKPPPDLSESLE